MDDMKQFRYDRDDAITAAVMGGKKMSVLIRNMEMPTSCADCRLMADGWCYSVGLEQREKISTVKRPTWCPLIPVPPHGRLIDADALRQSMYHEAFETDSPMQKWDSGCWIRYKMFERMEENAPTIIPAEEGE